MRLINLHTREYYDIIELEAALFSINYKKSIADALEWESGQDKFHVLDLKATESGNYSWTTPEEIELMKALRQLGITEDKINIREWW